jgi:hypothetical protein
MVRRKIISIIALIFVSLSAFAQTDITTEDFASSVVKLMNDTSKLSKLNYNIYDSFISNVMYDEGFKMVDMDDYFYLPKDKLKDISKNK